MPRGSVSHSPMGADAISCITRMEQEYNHALCDERHRHIDSCLEKHGAQIDSLEKCTIQLTQMIRKYDERLDDHQKRLSLIESKPGKALDRLVGYCLSALFGALAAYLSGLLIR